MPSRPDTRSLLVRTLAASVVLHIGVFAALRLADPAVVHEKPLMDDPIEIISLSQLTLEPEATEPPTQVAGDPTDIPRSLSEASVASAIVEPATTTSIADLKIGIKTVTALKGAEMPVDDSEIRFESPEAADAVLSAPYPFPRLGGPRIGLAGGGNCPASPAFP